MKKLLWLVPAVALAVLAAGYFAGRAQTARWERYAGNVSVTHSTMRAYAQQIQLRYELPMGVAEDIVELMACTNAPRPSQYREWIHAAAAAAQGGRRDARAAVAMVLLTAGVSDGAAVSALHAC